MASKRIYFVRHGETDANLHEYVPSKDEPLNATGLRQADMFAERVKGMDFEKLIVSDFVRAKQTAKTIAEAKILTPEVHGVFGEVMEPTSLFGMHDSTETVIGYRTKRNVEIENPEWRQEDGENFSDVFTRIKNAKQFLEDETVSNVLIVSHSFFIQLFAASILFQAEAPTKSWFKIARTLKLSNTGITLFTIDEGEWKLIMWNDHAHFAE